MVAIPGFSRGARRRQHTLLAAAVLAALAAPCAAWSADAAGGTRGAAPRVDAGVWHALSGSERISVVATLSGRDTLPRVAPSRASARSASGRGQALRALRSEIALRQGRVLEALGAGEFELLYRYAVVPALALRASRAAVERLATHADVSEVARDGVMQLQLAESVPLLRADLLESPGFGGSRSVTGGGVRVALLDSGIDTDHPDLAADLVGQRCLLAGAQALGYPGCPPPPDVAQDDIGHGTAVAGVVTGDGNLAPRGVAPDAEILAYKVCTLAGSGGVCSVADWLAALSDIIDNEPEVRLVNMSFGIPILHTGYCDSDATLPPEFQRVLASQTFGVLRALGVATFVSSGNQAQQTLGVWTDGVSYPACLADAVSVGAVYSANEGFRAWSNCVDGSTSSDQVACYSQSAPTLDLLGPGACCTATTGLGGTTLPSFSGTSSASAHATGSAALLLECDPGLTPDELEFLLASRGTPIYDPRFARSGSRVDPLAACELACAGEIAPEIPPAGGVVSGSTQGEPDSFFASCGGGGSPERVYRWTPAASGTAILETCGAGTSYDSLLYLLAGTCVGSWSENACDDDACSAASRLLPQVVDGQTYTVVVDGYGGAAGDFELKVVPEPGAAAQLGAGALLLLWLAARRAPSRGAAPAPRGPAARPAARCCARAGTCACAR